MNPLADFPVYASSRDRRIAQQRAACFSGHFGPRGRCKYGTVQCTRHLDRPAEKLSDRDGRDVVAARQGACLGGVGAAAVIGLLTGSGFAVLGALVMALALGLWLSGLVREVVTTTIPASEVEAREADWWLHAELPPLPAPSPGTPAAQLDAALAEYTHCAEGHVLDRDMLAATKWRKPCGCPTKENTARGHDCERYGHVLSMGRADCLVCGEEEW